MREKDIEKYARAFERKIVELIKIIDVERKLWAMIKSAREVIVVCLQNLGERTQ